MNSLEHDMGQMVREAKASEAKKSLAMNYVRQVGKISNQEEDADITDLYSLVQAQIPIILEMYLEPRVDSDTIEYAIQRHLVACPVALQVARRKDDDDLHPFNWQRMLFTVATKISWPGAAVIIVWLLQDDFRTGVARLLTP